MEDENLNHLIPRKDEIKRVSPWSSVKLRLIRDDLAPLIARGVPIKHLLKLLAPLDITGRRETVRQFIRDEFPDDYARYYAKRVTVEKMKRQPGERKETRTLAPTKTPAPEPAPNTKPEPVPEKTKPTPERKTKRLSVDSMLGQVGDFAAGKHLDTTKEQDDDSGH